MILVTHHMQRGAHERQPCPLSPLPFPASSPAYCGAGACRGKPATILRCLKAIPRYTHVADSWSCPFSSIRMAVVDSALKLEVTAICYGLSLASGCIFANSANDFLVEAAQDRCVVWSWEWEVTVLAKLHFKASGQCSTKFPFHDCARAPRLAPTSLSKVISQCLRRCNLSSDGHELLCNCEGCWMTVQVITPMAKKCSRYEPCYLAQKCLYICLWFSVPWVDALLGKLSLIIVASCNSSSVSVGQILVGRADGTIIIPKHMARGNCTYPTYTIVFHFCPFPPRGHTKGTIVCLPSSNQLTMAL